MGLGAETIQKPLNTRMELYHLKGPLNKPGLNNLLCRITACAVGIPVVCICTHQGSRCKFRTGLVAIVQCAWQAHVQCLKFTITSWS